MNVSNAQIAQDIGLCDTIYSRLQESGYEHKTVNRSTAEYARCVSGYARIAVFRKKNCRRI